MKKILIGLCLLASVASFAHNTTTKSNCSEINVTNGSTFIVKSESYYGRADNPNNCSLGGDCEEAELTAKTDGLKTCYESFKSCSVKHILTDRPHGSYCGVEVFIEGSN